jgi:hypothetical protein
MKAAFFLGPLFLFLRSVFEQPVQVVYSFPSSDDQAGGGPAAAHFSCFAKKSKQKKGWSTAPTKQVRSPFGVPGVDRHKSGGETNSLRSNKFPLFIRFAPAATGCSQAGIPDWLAAHRQGTEVDLRSSFFATAVTTT